MSQKLTPDSAQKGFAVGRGLLAAAETLNFSMSEPRSDSLYGSSSRPLGGMSGALDAGDGKDHDSQLPRRGGSHLSNTMKLFTSLGLSPTDLDVLAQVPEENINVETLPHLIMQLKNRKMEASRRMAGDHRELTSISPDQSYRGGRDDWGDMQGDRMDSSNRQTSMRGPQVDFGYSSMQDIPARGYEMIDYGNSSGGGGGGRDRQYSELSHDRYCGVSMAPSAATEGVFMQRRMGSPSPGKVQDFLGVMPHMFPHVCSLCDFDVHSMMEWTEHTNGIRHAENRRVLLQVYPDWDPHMPTTRGPKPLLLDTKSPSDGLLGPAPLVGGMQRTGMTSSWGSDSGLGMGNKMQPQSMQPKIRSRVVVAKYDRKPLSSNSLFALAKPFGTIREHLVLKNKAFLELKTHEEALAMVSYYQRKPALLYGKEIQIYLSKELLVIEKSGRPDKDMRNAKERESQVVFFSNLPRETEKKMELLTIARRFGTVEKHLFLNDQAFVQMANPEDAEMLVKYYTLHSLTIGRRNIRLNICTKYKTLTVPPGKGGQGRQDSNRKSGGGGSGSRASSKSQRSSSVGSRTKDISAERADKSEAQGEGTGEEVAGVMEADEEEGYERDPALEEMDDSAAEADQAMTAQLDETETPGTEEDAGPETAEDGTGDACEEDSTEKAEEADSGQDNAFEGRADDEDQTDQAESTEAADESEAPDNTQQTEDENDAEASTEQEGATEPDFPENMDEFVTLDELADEEEADRHEHSKASKDSSRNSKASGGLRVVNVVGFKRGYGYLDEILALAKPFGKVVRHLVLDVRPEAFLELSNEQEARAMVSFYSSNVIPSVCGKPVKIYHSQTYATIQSGKVIYIGQIPHFKTSDASLLKIAEPFGKIRRYFLNRLRNECFIEMERGEDAERMAEAYKDNPPKFQGKRLIVYVSRKYKQLKHGHRPPSPEPEEKEPCKRKRSEDERSVQSDSASKGNSTKDDEPPVKKVKEEKASVDKKENVENQEEKENKEVLNETSLKKEEVEESIADTTDTQKTETVTVVKEEEAKAPSAADVSEKTVETEAVASTLTQPEKKPEASPFTLGPYDPNNPVGVEYVKMGYYCRVCFLFYSNEETAKKVHCSSQAHYTKLKKFLEKEKTKTQSNAGKK
ncbi:matrin-3 [Chanos chanos]|uniref:Matrin-3 n=1 Tax=Chanos chanos TaxID=29144 RepID=A0A6J2X115_CHACN|nr:matrin-3-like [Chanos chanos]